MRYGVAAVSIGSAKRRGEVDGAVVLDVGGPAVSLRGSRQSSGPGIAILPGVGGDAGEAEQAMEIDLVAGTASALAAKGGEHEGAFGSVFGG